MPDTTYIGIMGLFASGLLLHVFYWFFVLLVRQRTFRKIISIIYLLVLSWLFVQYILLEYYNFTKLQDSSPIIFDVWPSVILLPVITLLLFLINKLNDEKIQNIKFCRTAIEVFRWFFIAAVIIYVILNV